MSKGTVEVCDNNEQLLAELERLLERQLAAARADDLATVETLSDECASRAAAIGHTVTVSNHKQRLEKLHCQMECILADKLAATEQQLSLVQKSKKLLDAYRP
jgi:hypothetical protein